MVGSQLVEYILGWPSKGPEESGPKNSFFGLKMSIWSNAKQVQDIFLKPILFWDTLYLEVVGLNPDIEKLYSGFRPRGHYIALVGLNPEVEKLDSGFRPRGNYLAV